MEKIFRALVVLALLLNIALFLLVQYWPAIYDEASLNAMSWNQYGALVVHGDLFYVILLALYAVVYIGLFAFNKYARHALVVLVLFAIVSSPFEGLAVSGGIDSGLGYALSVIEGVLISMAYFTSLHAKFAGNA